MKVLHLSTGDLSGGAFRGAYWLHQGLLERGVDSSLLVKNKTSDDTTVVKTSQNGFFQKFDKVKNSINDIPLLFYKDRATGMFSSAWASATGLKRAIEQANPDIIHLHWINDGLLKPEDLRHFDIPIVWTLRDMWPFSGGCHYAGSCTKYIDSCGACPHLGSHVENDLSRKLWTRKHKSWEKSNITLVAISQWVADCASQSKLFKDRRVEVIHNALNENVFRPLSKTFSREVLGLPLDKKIVAFGAINAIKNTNKGFQHLAPALRKLSADGLIDDVEVVIFGSSKPTQPLDLGLKVNYLGRLSDNTTLALVYSAADVMIVPSVQEAFGKTAIEAMACGTPVVSFDSTGLKDIVDHQQTGYRARCFDSVDLANGIAWVLENPERQARLSEKSRESVEKRFTVTLQAKAYNELYQDLIASTL